MPVFKGGKKSTKNKIYIINTKIEKLLCKKKVLSVLKDGKKINKFFFLNIPFWKMETKSTEKYHAKKYILPLLNDKKKIYKKLEKIPCQKKKFYLLWKLEKYLEKKMKNDHAKKKEIKLFLQIKLIFFFLKNR